MLAIWTWVVAHQTILAGLAVGVLDFVFAVKPSWASSGIVHWLWLKLKSIAGVPAAPGA